MFVVFIVFSFSFHRETKQSVLHVTLMVQLDGFYVLGTFLTAAQISLQGYHLSLKFLPFNFNERRVTDDLFVFFKYTYLYIMTPTAMISPPPLPLQPFLTKDSIFEI